MTNEWENVLLHQSLSIDKINRCLEGLFSRFWDLMSLSKVELILIIDITIDGFTTLKVKLLFLFKVCTKNFITSKLCGRGKCVDDMTRKFPTAYARQTQPFMWLSATSKRQLTSHVRLCKAASTQILIQTIPGLSSHSTNFRRQTFVISLKMLSYKRLKHLVSLEAIRLVAFMVIVGTWIAVGGRMNFGKFNKIVMCQGEPFFFHSKYSDDDNINT